MKTQTRMLDNRKIELHRKGKKSRTVRITPIFICLYFFVQFTKKAHGLKVFWWGGEGSALAITIYSKGT